MNNKELEKILLEEIEKKRKILKENWNDWTNGYISGLEKTIRILHRIKGYEVLDNGNKIGEIYTNNRNKAYWKCISSYCEIYGWHNKKSAFKSLRLVRNNKLDNLSHIYEENKLYSTEFIDSTYELYLKGRTD